MARGTISGGRMVLPSVTSISSFTYRLTGVSVHITFIEERWHGTAAHLYVWVHLSHIQTRGNQWKRTGADEPMSQVRTWIQLCCCSVSQSCPTLCDLMDCSTPGFLSITISHRLLKLRSIQSVMPLNYLICRPLLLLPSIFPSIRIFSNQSVLHIRWPKYGSFSISPSNEYSRLISFRIDWLDLLAVKGTLRNLLQHHSSKPSILRHSAFFMVQLSQAYMTTGKTIALTKWTFVGKVMSLLFNMWSRLVVAFLPRSKRFLIPWLQSPFAVILELKKI